MSDLGADAHGELLLMASIRGRFCELLASQKDGSDAGGEGFLAGMCSCLDAILEQPMAAILDERPVSSALTAALLGQDNAARRLLDCAIAYGRGDWDTCLRLADVEKFDRAWLSPAHADALGWAHRLPQQSTDIRSH